jgi:hypothetical protein
MQSIRTASQPARPKRVLSERAIEANRRNAQKSTGPRTEEGKAASRLNAGRHKITAQVTILPDEERVAAEDFCGKLAATFNPEGLEEIQLARGIAENYWRLNQARAAIANRFALSLTGQPPHPMAGGHPQIEYAIEIAETFDRDANCLRLISLYEQRTFNLLQRQKRELEAMQKAREQKRQAALNEAQDLYAYAAAHGEAWSAEAEAKANDGFVFSPSFLEDAIRRRTRLHAARLAQSGLFTQNANRPSPALSAGLRSFPRPAA